jgi:hypothetical protein
MCGCFRKEGTGSGHRHADGGKICRDLFAFIEGDYNRVRLPAILGYFSRKGRILCRIIWCPLSWGKVSRRGGLLMKPILRPIDNDLLPAFSAYLNEKLNSTIPVDQWTSALRSSWDPQGHGYGFCLTAGNQMVGGIGTIYSVQNVRGKDVRFCNITSWCVDLEFRSYGVQLLGQILKQPDCVFTNFSPTPTVEGMLRFFGFRSVPSRLVLVPNFPVLGGGTAYFGDDAVRHATIPLRRIIEDQRESTWLHHVLAVTRDGDNLYMMGRNATYHRLPVVEMLYSSKPVMPRRAFALIRSALLGKGFLLTMVAHRYLAGSLPFSQDLAWGHNVYYRARGMDISDDDIGIVYSEFQRLPM